jgi:DNA methylase
MAQTTRSPTHAYITLCQRQAVSKLGYCCQFRPLGPKEASIIISSAVARAVNLSLSSRAKTSRWFSSRLLITTMPIEMTASELGRFGRNRSNLWNAPGANSFARSGPRKQLESHPTVKPIALVADAMLDCTQRNDIVLDPYLGSGTTILAAERTGRRCHAIEIDGRYVDTAIRRWERLTKQEAKDINGKPFAQTRSDRGADQ